MGEFHPEGPQAAFIEFRKINPPEDKLLEKIKS